VPSAGPINDDFAYVLGLGLIVRRGGEYVIANPIYREVIPRVLSVDQQFQIHLRPSEYLRPDGGLDMVKIRRDSETEVDALEQPCRYLEEAGLREGWLVLFDPRKRRSWKEKLTTRKRRRRDCVLWVVGC
jgi:hypothetical protein